MLDGETIKSGAAKVCDECNVEVLTRLGVQRSGAGYYVGTTCECGPYSRESGYYRTGAEAAEALASGSYGRGEEPGGALAVWLVRGSHEMNPEYLPEEAMDELEEDLRP